MEEKEERVKVKEKMERALKDISKVVGIAKTRIRTSATSLADPDIRPMNAGTRTRTGRSARRIKQRKPKTSGKNGGKKKGQRKTKGAIVSRMQMMITTRKNPSKNQKQSQGFFNLRS